MRDLQSSYDDQKQSAIFDIAAAEKNLKKGLPIGGVIIQTNLHAGFDNLIGQALIEWRHDFADPRPTLQKAMAVAHRAASLMPQAFEEAAGYQKRPFDRANPTRIIEPISLFHFPIAAIFSTFVQDSVDSVCLDNLPATNAINKQFIREGWYLLLDVALARSLAGQHDEQLWSQLLDFASSRKNLGVRSFVNYLNIYKAVIAENAPVIQDMVKEGDRLYEARCKDRFYGSLLNLYEVGPFANYFLDHRLAAVIQFAERKIRNMPPLETIHRWKW